MPSCLTFGETRLIRLKDVQHKEHLNETTEAGQKLRRLLLTGNELKQVEEPEPVAPPEAADDDEAPLKASERKRGKHTRHTFYPAASQQQDFNPTEETRPSS